MKLFFVSCLDSSKDVVKQFKKFCEDFDIDFIKVNLVEDKIDIKDKSITVNNEEYTSEDSVILVRKWVLNSNCTQEIRKQYVKLQNFAKTNNIPIFNKMTSSNICRSKWDTYEKLCEYGVSTIDTKKLTIDNYIKLLHNRTYPVVIKPDKCSKGHDVCCFYNEIDALKFTQNKLSEYDFLLLQDKIDISYDLRMHVVCTSKELSNNTDDYSVIACMKRTAAKDDFRTNYSVGGSISLYTPNESEKLVAIKAAIATGCRWCGVDVLHDAKTDIDRVIEVNSSPGLEGINSLYSPSEHNVIYRIVKIISKYFNPVKYTFKESKIVSFNEHVKLDNVKMIGCFDTGKEGNTCSICVDNLEISDGYASFDLLDNHFKKKIEGYVVIKLRPDEKNKRPIVKFDLTVGSKTLKDIDVTIRNIDKSEKNDDREKILIGTDVIHKLDFLVSPDREKLFRLNENNEDWKKKICFLRLDWPKGHRDIKLRNTLTDLYEFPNIRAKSDEKDLNDMIALNYINTDNSEIEFFKNKYQSLKNLKNNFDVLKVCSDKSKFYDTFKDCDFICKNLSKEDIENTDSDIICKPIRGTHSSQGIFIDKNKNILKDYQPDNYIYQKLIDIVEEYRILVFNKQIISCYRRHPINSIRTKGKDDRLNFLYELVQLDSDMLEKIQDIANTIFDKTNANGLIGIDLAVTSDNKIYCIEINSRSGLSMLDLVIVYLYLLKTQLGYELNDDILDYCFNTYVKPNEVSNRSRLDTHGFNSINNINLADYEEFKKFCSKL